MATLVFTAIGTAIGGPIGGAIGAFVGQQVDREIFAPPGREGPRLQELALTTSSYGTPIARHYGRMRSAGSIIWATDLRESRETSGGGKGKPKSTTYSYSTSFAVALSSRPIQGVGRIWADGDLLRGSAGDLKVAGSIRIHRGLRDQSPDPLLYAAEPDRCPAYRGCAYIVFEDLQLADFGNRIPGLAFEVIADDGTITLASMLDPLVDDVTSDVILPAFAGYTIDATGVAGAIAAIDPVVPMDIASSATGISLTGSRVDAADPVTLPEATAGWTDGDFGPQSGHSSGRDARTDKLPHALRYYDTERDYLPGLQRANPRSRPSNHRALEVPAALGAQSAFDLIDKAANRLAWRQDKLSWRVAELDPELMPGMIVKVPGRAGTWRIDSWEWRERGIDLELNRLPPVTVGSQGAADTGSPARPFDEILPPTWFEAFELPWDGFGSPDERRIYAAVSATNPSWSGATLYSDAGGELLPVQSTGRARSVAGTLVTPLPPSPAMVFQPTAALDVDLLAGDMAFMSAGVAALARGANRLLVGDEVLQFAEAVQIDGRRWRLVGLLRGRGGTEAEAQQGSPAGARVVAIDDTLVALETRNLVLDGPVALAAIGVADEEPVIAELTGAGNSRRPLSPVHPSVRIGPDGTMELCWTRRARGAWEWRDAVDTPLVEETESYRLGLGPVEAPFQTWVTTTNRLELAASTVASLAQQYPDEPLWVRQIGRFGVSRALLLTRL